MGMGDQRGEAQEFFDGTARQTGKTHIASPAVPARPGRASSARGFQIGRALECRSAAGAGSDFVPPKKYAAVQIYDPAKLFVGGKLFFRNEPFFIVISSPVV
jgi:hypothetical protein